MNKETNLALVKETATALLWCDIAPTPYSPMIVSHPFTNTGISAIRDEDGRTKMLDLTKDTDLSLWRQAVQDQIDDARDVLDVYRLFNKPYLMVFLHHAQPFLSTDDFSNLLADAWVRTESPHNDPNFTREDLLDMFHAADRRVLMDESEYAEYEALDDPVTVYRGVTPYNADSVDALSWSLSYDTAKWFSQRYGQNGTVYSAEISKEHIFALFSSRNEAEVIVDPAELMHITPVDDIDEGFGQTLC